MFQIVISSTPKHAFGVAVYGNYVYWTDWIRRAVIRAHKFDNSDVRWMEGHIERQPMGIIVVAEDINDCTFSFVNYTINMVFI